MSNILLWNIIGNIIKFITKIFIILPTVCTISSKEAHLYQIRLKHNLKGVFQNRKLLLISKRMSFWNTYCTKCLLSHKLLLLI